MADKHMLLKDAVRDGAPGPLFDLGEFILRALAKRIEAGQEIKAMSGSDIARIILDWATVD